MAQWSTPLDLAFVKALTRIFTAAALSLGGVAVSMAANSIQTPHSVLAEQATSIHQAQDITPDQEGDMEGALIFGVGSLGFLGIAGLSAYDIRRTNKAAVKPSAPGVA